MSQISKEHKLKIANDLKAILKGINLKYSLTVRDHKTLVMTIHSGPIDFIGEYDPEWTRFLKSDPKDDGPPPYMKINVLYYYKYFIGESLRIIDTILKTLCEGNHKNCHPNYVEVNLGTWKKPYILTS